MKRSKAGFTLLELIIVIIIVGVLTSLAVSRIFTSIERAKAVEAMTTLATLRSSMERCMLKNNDGDGLCFMSSITNDNELDIDDPADAPGSRFFYNAGSAMMSGKPGRYCLSADYKDNFLVDRIFMCDFNNEIDVFGVGKYSYLNN